MVSILRAEKLVKALKKNKNSRYLRKDIQDYTYSFCHVKRWNSISKNQKSMDNS